MVDKVAARPCGGRRKIWTEWKADSGVKKTLLSEEDWEFMKKHITAAKIIPEESSHQAPSCRGEKEAPALHAK